MEEPKLFDGLAPTGSFACQFDIRLVADKRSDAFA